MTCSEFENLVKIQLEILRGRLVSGHHSAVAELEARATKKHFQQQGAPSQDTPGSLPGGAWAAPGGCTAVPSVGGRRNAVFLDTDAERPPHSSTPDSNRMQLPVLLSESQDWDPLAVPLPPAWPSLLPPADGIAINARSLSLSDGDFQLLEIWNQLALRTNSSRGSGASLASSTDSSVDHLEVEAELTEQHWEANLKCLMLSPSSMWYLFWQIISFGCIAHDVIIIPLQAFGPQRTTFRIFMSWLIRLFWTFDIFVNFITGYVTPYGRVEMRPTQVAWRYFHTWFFLDLMLVGCDWVEAIITTITGTNESDDATVLRLLGMLRTIRLIRLVRLINSQRISEFVFEHLRSEGLKLITYIVSVIMVLLCLVHVFACLWHGIRGDAEAGVPDAEADLLAAHYLLSFHHVLALFLGEHALQPRNLLERIFVIAVLVFAWVVTGAFVGSLATAMTQLQIVASKRSSQFATLNHYLSDNGITRELTARVQRNARHALQEQQRRTPESSVELMALISEHLRSEIHYEVFSPILTVHPFFGLYNSVSPVGMRHICHTSVSQKSLSRGDVLFSEAELAVVPKMFFIVSGRLAYMRGVESQQRVHAKQWVAEAVLWTKWTHRGTLRALTECCTLALDASRLASIMSIFPTCHGSRYAVKFVENLNSHSPDVTDIPESVEHVRRMAIDAFSETDPHFRVPPQWNSGMTRRRSSILSVLSLGNQTTSVTSIVPATATGDSEIP